jgi:hypothetical protein
VSFGNLVADLASFHKIGRFYFQSSGHSVKDFGVQRGLGSVFTKVLRASYDPSYRAFI